MSFDTTEVNEATPIEATTTESSAHLTVSSTVYRSYGVFDENGKAKGVKSASPSVMSETNTKDNWKKAEEAGATVLNENQFKFYTLTDLAGFVDLVPSETQRLYIVQKGIDALQTAAANAYQSEFVKKVSKDEPDVYVYNGETIDLREDINEPPQRRNISPEEKFMRAAGALDQAKLIQMLEKFKENLLAQGSI